MNKRMAILSIFMLVYTFGCKKTQSAEPNGKTINQPGQNSPIAPAANTSTSYYPPQYKLIGHAVQEFYGSYWCLDYYHDPDGGFVPGIPNFQSGSSCPNTHPKGFALHKFGCKESIDRSRFGLPNLSPVSIHYEYQHPQFNASEEQKDCLDDNDGSAWVERKN